MHFHPSLVAVNFQVHAVSPQRTFWESELLLHEETSRRDQEPRKARLARHYYDSVVSH